MRLKTWVREHRIECTLGIVYVALALILALLCGQIRAQTVTIANPASVAQVRWVDVAVPLVEGEERGPMLFGPGWLAVPGQELGINSQMWHIRAVIAAGGVVSSDKWAPAEWTKADDVWPPMTAADAMRMVPWLAITDASGRREAQCPQVQVIYRDLASVVWRLEAHAAGWHLVCWQTQRPWQDVVDVAGYVTWSDPTSPAWFLDGVTVELRWDVPAELYGARRQGLQKTAAGTWTLWRGRMADGFGLPFRGVLIPPASDPLGRGAAESQLFGAATWPDGTWLAFGARPDVPATSRQRHDDWLAGTGTLLDARPGASALETGSTGSQACFGAQKGVGAASGDPWAIRELLWAADDGVLRCGHHLETNGSPVTRATHPRWETWSQASERNAGDRLGKPSTQPWGWDRIGARSILIDDQHRGDAPEIAAYALSGDWLLLEDLKLRLNADEARAKSIRGQLDAPRASGRLWQSWAKLATVARPEMRAQLQALALRELDLAFAAWPAGAPVRPSWVIKDDRVLPGGLSSWVPWNEAQKVLGALEEARAWGRLGENGASWRFLALAKELSRTIVEYGTLYSTEGQWLLCTGVQYFAGGDAPPAGYYVFPRPGASYSPDPGINLLVGTPGWHEWASAAYVIADTPRAREILRAVRPGPGASTTALEWWAVR